MPILGNIGGIFHNAKPFVNINGIWHPVKKAFVNVGGMWRQSYTAGATVIGAPVSTWGYGDQHWSGTPTLVLDDFGFTVTGDLHHTSHGQTGGADEDLFYIHLLLSFGEPQNIISGNPFFKTNMAISTGESNLSAFLEREWFGNDSYAISIGSVAPGTVANARNTFSTDSVNLGITIPVTAGKTKDVTVHVSFTIPNSALSIMTGASGTDEYPIIFA